MTATELLLDRRSVRKYEDKIVARETMDEIMELTRFAPSWTNAQVARYTLITDEAIIARLGEEAVNGFAYNISTLQNAKNVCVLSYVSGKSGKYEDEYVTTKKGDWEVFDAGIACQTFCLAAHAKGVGSVVMGIIDPDKIAQIIDLPQGQTVAALIPYGYPAKTPKAPPRLSVDEITRYL